jgi:Holliday junction DNA helicase RuvA
MISSLQGRVGSRTPGLVVLVGGIGFSVHVSARTAAMLPAEGEMVALHTYLHVREDLLVLYGFSVEEERALFLHMLSVNGVGPRMALGALSSAPHEELHRALQEGDEAYLVRIPGIGKKTAARLVLELKGKLPLVAPQATPAARLADPLLDEAVLALVSIGVVPRTAREAVERVRARGLPKDARVEDVVKAALQSSGRAAAD